MSKGTDAMGDVQAKLRWADKHLADLMAIGHEYLQPDGGDTRPLGIRYDNSRPPLVIVRFIIDKSPPIELSLHASDLIHNTRTALDHVLARLKDHFGGDPGQGSFPTWRTQPLWDEKVTNAKRNPLDRLDARAVALIYDEQPLHQAAPADDPLIVVNSLDNDDKHRLLHHGFAYPTAARGLDLIQIRDRKLILSEENVWTTGQPLDNGTVLARLRVRGMPKGLLRADPAAEVKLSTGPLDAPKTSYEDMICRVRGIADKAAALIDTLP